MNILLIAIDTLRADHLGCYGYTKKTSPNIDKLASEGVLFEQAYAPDIPTQPAYTTIYTGQYGLAHGIVSHGAEEQVLSDSLPLLPEIVQRAGLVTAAVDNLLSMKRWFARGYEYYIQVPKTIQFLTAEEVNSRAIQWLRENYHRPFFLFVHYWDPHTPYLPPDEYKRKFYQGNERDPKNRSLEGFKKSVFYPFFNRWLMEALGEVTDIEYIIAQYDAEIAYVDAKLGQLLAALEELKISEETLVILTSDHGESLTEHGIYFDHHGVYQNTIRVPLILRLPGELPEGKRIDGFVEHIDIAPTILEALGKPALSYMEGKSLLKMAQGKRSNRLFVVCGECTYQAKRALVTKKWKQIKSIGGDLYNRPRVELYDLEKDPEETLNVAEGNADIVDRLELQLSRWVEDKLKERPDPIRIQLSRGLPGHLWLKRALEAQSLHWEEWIEKQRYV